MIEAWTWPTPNGHKIHIALEELGLPYKVIPVNIGKGEQFKPEFLAITPNHRIPAIVDPDGPGGKPFTLFESAAIMMYLSEKCGGALIPRDPIGKYRCLEWMMFQMADIITFPWIRNPDRRWIDMATYPHVKRWHDAVAARPAVQRGVQVLAENQRKGQITDAERENYFGKTQFSAR